MSNNLLFRFDITEWAGVMALFPPDCASTVAIFPEGTVCDVTGEIVPPDSVHVALVGVSDDNAARIVEALPGWTVEAPAGLT